MKAADPELVEELIGVLIAAKKTELAIPVLRQMERSDRVLRRIVDVYEMAHQTEKAVPELEELHRLHPDDPYYIRRLAELAVVRRDFAKAADYYKTLYQLDPGNAKIKTKWAESMVLEARQDVAKERWVQAIARFDDSFRLVPPDNKLKREYAGLPGKSGPFWAGNRHARTTR